MRIDRALWGVAPYNVYTSELPQRLDPHLQTYIWLLNRTSHNSGLRSVTTIVVTDYANGRVRQRPPEYLNLHTFGRFRKHYSAMEQTAEALAPLYSEIQILPVVIPVTSKEWQTQENSQGPVYEKIREQGIIAYSVEAFLGASPTPPAWT